MASPPDLPWKSRNELRRRFFVVGGVGRFPRDPARRPQSELRSQQVSPGHETPERRKNDLPAALRSEGPAETPSSLGHLPGHPLIPDGRKFSAVVAARRLTLCGHETTSPAPKASRGTQPSFPLTQSGGRGRTAPVWAPSGFRVGPSPALVGFRPSPTRPGLVSEAVPLGPGTGSGV